MDVDVGHINGYGLVAEALASENLCECVFVRKYENMLSYAYSMPLRTSSAVNYSSPRCEQCEAMAMQTEPRYIALQSREHHRFKYSLLSALIRCTRTWRETNFNKASPGKYELK
jgi:hypothetical protein